MKRCLGVIALIMLFVCACSPQGESTGEAAQAVVTFEPGDETLENAAIDVHRVDSEWNILSANQHELTSMHCSSEQYVGQSIVDFHASIDTITAMAVILAGGGKLSAYPAELVRCDGVHIYVLISSNTYRPDPLAPTAEFVHTRCFTTRVSYIIWLFRKIELGLL
jgi:two-component system, OmpR family, sensor histidine kinase VicK